MRLGRCVNPQGCRNQDNIRNSSESDVHDISSCPAGSRNLIIPAQVARRTRVMQPADKAGTFTLHSPAQFALVSAIDQEETP